MFLIGKEHYSSGRLIAFVLAALMLSSCAQQKGMVNTHEAQKEEMHRYTTVYEGNKIIKYPQQEQVRPSRGQVPQVDKTLVIASTQPLVNEENKPNRKPERKTVRVPSLKEAFIRSKLPGYKQQHKAQPTDEPKEEGAFESPGLVSFVLLLASVAIVLFNIPNAVFIATIFAIMAVVFAVIGVGKQASALDLAFAVGVLTLSIIGLIALFAYAGSLA